MLTPLKCALLVDSKLGAVELAQAVVVSITVSSACTECSPRSSG